MLFYYFLGILFFLETAFRGLCTGKVMGVGLFYSFMFAIPVATLLYLFCSLFKPEKRMKIATLTIGVLCLLFVSQFIYFKIFRMFYSVYSMTKGGQIFEFWQIILMKVKNNFLGVVLLILPLVSCWLLKDKVCQGERIISIKERMGLVGILVGMHVIALLSLNLAGKEAYTPYDLYFKHHYPVVAAEKVGLVTTLRLDMKRSLFNLSPQLASQEQNVTLVEGKVEEEVYETISHSVENTTDQKEYNMLDIDFEALQQQEISDELKDMDNYFKEVKPTEKNKYTGKYKGFNLIQITAESFSPYAIDKELTPTLYRLAHEGYQFKNFYTPLWELSTSDGEYAIMMSQIPKSGTWSMKESSDHAQPFSLGNQLRKQGYQTMAFHNHDYNFYDRQLSHPNLGYEYIAKGQGLPVTDTWPESDEEMIDLTVGHYVNKQPFHVYYMTVSGHMQYSFSENDMSKKYEEVVKDLNMSEDARAYLASQIELDRAVEKLLEQLEAEGVLENTLIAITPDHYPYGLNNEYISELAGETVEEDFDIFKSTFILWTPHMTPTVIEKPCSSLDILPTLSNLMGVDYDSRLLVGRDIFSEAEPLVMLYSHNFITGKGKYNAITREFMKNLNADVDEDYVNKMIREVEKRFYYSAKILEEDYYNHVLMGIK